MRQDFLLALLGVLWGFIWASLVHASVHISLASRDALGLHRGGMACRKAPKMFVSLLRCLELHLSCRRYSCLGLHVWSQESATMHHCKSDCRHKEEDQNRLHGEKLEGQEAVLYVETVC